MTEKISVYLVQVNYHQVFNNKIDYWLPYTVGILWAYASQFDDIVENYNLEKLLYRRDPVDEVAASIKDNSVVILSSYVWNWEYNTLLAKKIKELGKKCFIIMGGPQVTKRPLETGFFKKHPYVDTIILGEGEESLVDCLRKHAQGKKQKIYQSQRLNDLDIPSPYLTGLFDDLIQNNTNVAWKAVIETNRGCPFKCTFCDWGSLIYSKVKKFPEDRVFAELEWMAKNKIEYITFADANFGIFKQRDFDIAKKLCEYKKDYNYPNNINLCYNKNSSSDVISIVKLFNEVNLNRGLTVSFQSLDEEVLDAINRKNMETSNAMVMFELFEKEKLNYYTELILGLPMETLASWKQGHFKLMNLGQHQTVDVFHAMVLENSELNQPDYRAKYGIETVEVQNFMGWNTVTDDDPIIEKLFIVRSTNTMQTAELIDAFMFSWIIVHFHSYGWTQIYSRFLNRAFDVSFENFYIKLEQYLKNSDSILADWYVEYQHRIKLYLDNNIKFIQSKYNADTLRDAQPRFHINNQEVHSLLSKFVKDNFATEIAKFDFTQLEKYQKYFISTFEQTYPHVVELDLGIQNSILNNESYTPHVTNCQIELYDLYPCFSKQDYLDRLITRRRNGWGRTVISAKK